MSSNTNTKASSNNAAAAGGASGEAGRASSDRRRSVSTTYITSPHCKTLMVLQSGMYAGLQGYKRENNPNYEQRRTSMAEQHQGGSGVMTSLWNK